MGPIKFQPYQISVLSNISPYQILSCQILALSNISPVNLIGLQHTAHCLSAVQHYTLYVLHLNDAIRGVWTRQTCLSWSDVVSLWFLVQVYVPKSLIHQKSISACVEVSNSSNFVMPFYHFIWWKFYCLPRPGITSTTSSPLTKL